MAVKVADSIIRAGALVIEAESTSETSVSLYQTPRRRPCCSRLTPLPVAGYKVSDTMRKGILEVSLYETAERELMMGCLASLGTCAPSKCLSVAPLTQH